MTRTESKLNEVAADLDLPGTVALQRVPFGPGRMAWFYETRDDMIRLGGNATEAEAALHRIARRQFEVTR